MLKSDLHSHTNYFIPRRDSKLSPKQLIDFASSRGYEVLAITEHASWTKFFGIKRHENPVRTYFDFKDYAKKRGILLIPGVETIVEGKEILLINFTGNAEKVNTFADVERLKDENVLVMAPHPFFKRASCLGNKLVEHIDLFDAIEHCHFYTKYINLNKRAIEIAKRYNKPLIANSDAHDFSQIDINFTLIDAKKKSIDDVLEAIRKNNVKIVTKPLPMLTFLKIAFWSSSTGLIKSLVD